MKTNAAPLIRLTIRTAETDGTPPGPASIDCEAKLTDEEPNIRMVRAVNLLVNALRDGPRPVSELRALAARTRLGRMDLKAARHELGVRSFAGEDGRHYWEFKQTF